MAPNCSTTTSTFINFSTGLIQREHDNDGLMDSLRIVMDILLITLTVLMMMSFGCSLDISHIRRHLAQPISVTLGLLLHFVCQPYIFYALEQVLQLNSYDKMALTVLATCPAGGISNLFLHYADGDLALGIIITAASTILALGFMPLNLWLFSRTWKDNFVLPYLQTFISLVTLFVPVGIGMIILRRSPKVAKWVSRLTSAVADVLILVTIGLSSFMYPQMYSSTWKTWFVTTMFTPISFLIGYSIALAMRMPADIRRTLGITTGAKSMALCLTIIALTFPTQEYLKYLVLPELHSIMMLIELVGYSFLYRAYRWCHGRYFISSEHNAHALGMNESRTSLTTAEHIDLSNGSLHHSHARRNRVLLRRMSDSYIHLPSIRFLSAKVKGNSSNC